MRRWSLPVIAGCALAACQTDPIRDHSQNPQVQEEIRLVVEKLRDSQGDALYQNLVQLVAYDVFAVDQVCELADSPNSKLRSNSMWVLGQIHDPRFPDIERKIVRTLKAGLSDSDNLVRYEAASGLLLRNQWDVIPVLLDGLGDPEPGVGHNCNLVLTQVTTRNFGYDIDLPPEEKQAAIQRWRDWYASWKKSSS